MFTRYPIRPPVHFHRNVERAKEICRYSTREVELRKEGRSEATLSLNTFDSRKGRESIEQRKTLDDEVSLST